MLVSVTASAQAQLRLPGGLGGGLPSVAVPTLQAPRLPDLQSANVALQGLRRQVTRELLRDNPTTIEADAAGEPVLRGELLLIDPPQASVDAALATGFTLRREMALEGLGLRSLVLAAPPGVATAEALARLRALDPQLVADFHHVYTRSGGTADAPTTPGMVAAFATTPAPRRRVGLIDSGIDRSHPALRRTELQVWGCANLAHPSPHGTAIASLLVGRDSSFVGVAPNAALYAADVYCGQPTGGSVEAIAQALAWLARERVAVINISLVGPPNPLLEAAVRAATARGHVIVAAVGNDGPAAPALYPAAYAQVVGVTGVAPSRRILPEASRGAHVAFAAPGAELAVAQAGSRGYAVARGTSFAAPLVAGLLAERLAEPDLQMAQQALRDLADGAVDLGDRGRDEVFGWGLVAEQARNTPERIQAMAGARR
jgi:Subtilase family